MECRLDRITVHYEVRGEGRPFLALHGWPLDHRAMVGAFEPIFAKRQGWKRIYPDLPGMGKTEGPEWLVTQDQVLDVLTEFIERVIRSERFTVAGLSYGGLLAQGLVHRLADRMDGLLLLVPSMGPEETRDLPSHHVIHREPISFEDVASENVAGFKNMAVVQTQEHLEAWKRDIIPGVKVADGEFWAVSGRTTPSHSTSLRSQSPSLSQLSSFTEGRTTSADIGTLGRSLRATLARHLLCSIAPVTLYKWNSLSSSKP